MPRRKSLYRRRLLEETEMTAGPDRPLSIPEGVPATIEVGMGAGRYLAARAAAEPGRFFVGVELKEERAWQAIRDARALGATANFRAIATPVAEADLLLPSARFDELIVLFPDPWPKDRDEWRRLIAPQHLRLYARWLRPGATGVFRTDSEPLFRYAEETLRSRGYPILRLLRDAPPGTTQTKFEELWRGERRVIHELAFERPALLPDDPLSIAESQTK
jgi:tRNA G46 methylase TrmB